MLLPSLLLLDMVINVMQYITTKAKHCVLLHEFCFSIYLVSSEADI